VSYLLDNNCFDTLVVSGTAGEFTSLTFAERVELFRIASEVIAGRKPIIAASGCASTKETIDLTKAAKDLGINTCMIVTPYYSKPTQKEIKEHYNSIAKACDVDILLYNIPLFAGVNLEPETVRELAMDKKIVGIKDEAGINPVQITDYYHTTYCINQNFLLINGDDVMLMPMIAQGATSIVSGGAHIVSEEIRYIFELCDKGKLNEAISVYRRIFKYFRINGINQRVNAVPMLKAAIEMITGIKLGQCRKPLIAATESERKALKDILEEMGKL